MINNKCSIPFMTNAVVSTHLSPCPVLEDLPLVHEVVSSTPRLSNLFSPFFLFGTAPLEVSTTLPADALCPPPTATNRDSSRSDARVKVFGCGLSRFWSGDASSLPPPLSPPVFRGSCRTPRALSTAVESWSLCRTMPGRIWSVRVNTVVESQGRDCKIFQIVYGRDRDCLPNQRCTATCLINNSKRWTKPTGQSVGPHHSSLSRHCTIPLPRPSWHTECDI